VRRRNILENVGFRVIINYSEGIPAQIEPLQALSGLTISFVYLFLYQFCV